MDGWNQAVDGEKCIQLKKMAEGRKSWRWRWLSVVIKITVNQWITHIHSLIQIKLKLSSTVHINSSRYLSFLSRSTHHLDNCNISASDSFSTMALYKSIYLLTYLLRKPVLVMQQEFKLILKYSHTHIVYINEISPSRDEKLSTTLALQARNIKYTCQDVEAN